MAKKRWLEMDRDYNGPISLWDFSLVEDAQDAAWVEETAKRGGWRISDDSVIGGFSRSTLQLIRTPDDYQRILRGEQPLSMLDPATIEESSMESTVQDTDESLELVDKTVDSGDRFIPFVRWKGTIDTRVNPDSTRNLEESGKNVQRSGFCAIRSSEFPYGGADLGGRYNGLEILCRSDGRPYSVNLRCESFIEGDLFQCFISIPPTLDPTEETYPINGGRFDKVVLLFRHFIVTAGGRVRSTQRILDNSVKIQSIGFTLMDGVNGDFQFDLARIRAVNYDERGVIGNVD